MKVTSSTLESATVAIPKKAQATSEIIEPLPKRSLLKVTGSR